MVIDIIGKLVEKTYLTDDVIFLSFQVSKEFTFKAGQFVSMKITKSGESKVRSYSLLNPPSRKGRVETSVKIVPGGFASEVFANAAIGLEIPMKGPLGMLTFDEQSTNDGHWFICTGTGVTPFHSMIQEHLPKHPDKKFVLLFGVRTKKDLFLHREFEELAARYPNFTFMPTFSREENHNGLTGRVQKHLPEDLKNKTFYICGLKDLVLETKELLVSRGVDYHDIHVERYT